MLLDEIDVVKYWGFFGGRGYGGILVVWFGEDADFQEDSWLNILNGIYL